MKPKTNKERIKQLEKNVKSQTYIIFVCVVVFAISLIFILMNNLKLSDTIIGIFNDTDINTRILSENDQYLKKTLINTNSKIQDLYEIVKAIILEKEGIGNVTIDTNYNDTIVTDKCNIKTVYNPINNF